MPLIGPERPQRGWGSLRDWLGMDEAKAVRSSWEFVVVGLNFFFCFSPTTSANAADPSDGLKDGRFLGRVGTCGHGYRSWHSAVVRLSLEHPV